MLPRVLLAGLLARGRSRLVRGIEGRCLVFRAPASDAAWDVLREEPIDVVIARAADLRPDASVLVNAVRAVPRPPEIVVVTTGPAGDLVASGATLIDAALTARAQLDILDLALERAVETRRRASAHHARAGSRSLDALGTTSRTIRGFQDEARRAAAGGAPILIRGEPGVGKTWLGEVLHAASPRAAGSFRRLSFAALAPEAAEAALFGHGPGVVPGRTRAARGLFELAHGGSLFLEHADRATPQIQQKLVDALRTRSFRALGVDREVTIDVRLIATVQVRPGSQPNGDGPALLSELRRHFDLADLTVPALRERTEDVRELADSALERFRTFGGKTAASFSAAALSALARHTWPGNYEELRSVVERAALLARTDEIQLHDLPADVVAEGGVGATGLHIDAPWLADSASLPRLREARAAAQEVVDRAYLHRLLRAARGRIGDAARRADIDPRSLNGLMRRHGVRKEDFKVTPRRSDG